MPLQSLNIEVSDYTPGIVFSVQTNVFEFTGSSHPPNVQDFYSPIFEWLDEYEQEIVNKKIAPEITINFKFDYLNTASMKYIAEFLFKIKKFEQQGINLLIHWYYRDMDEQMKEDGDDLSYALDLPFHFKVY